MTAGAVTVAFVLRGDGRAGAASSAVDDVDVEVDGVDGADDVDEADDVEAAGDVAAGAGVTEDGALTAGVDVTVDFGVTAVFGVADGADVSEAGLEFVTFDATCPTFPRAWLKVDTICSYASRPARLPRT